MGAEKLRKFQSAFGLLQGLRGAGRCVGAEESRNGSSAAGTRGTQLAHPNLVPYLAMGPTLTQQRS